MCASILPGLIIGCCIATLTFTPVFWASVFLFLGFLWLASSKPLIVAAPVGFAALRSVFGLAVTGERHFLVLAVVCGGLTAALIRWADRRRKYRGSKRLEGSVSRSRGAAEWRRVKVIGWVLRRSRVEGRDEPTLGIEPCASVGAGSARPSERRCLPTCAKARWSST